MSGWHLVAFLTVYAWCMVGAFAIGSLASWRDWSTIKMSSTILSYAVVVGFFMGFVMT